MVDGEAWKAKSRRANRPVAPSEASKKRIDSASKAPARAGHVGPFGRASFLDPWWRILAPAGFWKLGPEGTSAAFGSLGVTVAAGWGAADFATPAWGAGAESLLETRARRGLLLPRVVERSSVAGFAARLNQSRLPYDIAPRTDLSGGWESIESKRSNRTWSTLRRKERKLSENGCIEWMHVTDAEQLPRWLPAAFRLYAARAAAVRRGRLWQTKKGRRFLTAWMQGLAHEGALDLSFMLVGGEPQAFAFGISDPDSYYLYGLGFDPASALAKWSPGEQLLVHLLKSAADFGQGYFDFLVGDESYKRAWATENRVVSTVALGPNRAVREALLAGPRLVGIARNIVHRTQ